GYDLVLVGKATDNSGFGGAAFASVILDEEDEESNKGAVQVPDPFLKNVLIRSTYAVFEEARKNKIKLGFKDLGAGGVMCASSELCDSGGYGADVDLSKVHTSMNIPSFIIACSETQERFMWISPKEFTPTILKIYNKDFELPNVSECAKASVVGTVRNDRKFIMRHDGKVVCDAPIEEVTQGILYDREHKEKKQNLSEPKLEDLPNFNSVTLDVLKHPNICNKSKIHEHYDTQVLGNTIIGPGQADAGVLAPIPGHKAGMALSVDANPLYSRINPYMGACNAVAEAMRNVAAVGAVPSGMTDCLNFGNPELPESFSEFTESVKGLVDAANNIYLKGTEKTTKSPVAFVSGNVSFYNQSATGNSVDPSPVIACLGVMEDYSKAITMKIKKPNTEIYLLGPRNNELGGSVYYDLFGEIGENIPKIDFEQERNRIYAVTDSIDKGLLLSCHDISDGGMITAVAEMIMGGKADGKIGIELELNDDTRTDTILFTESPGFVMEIADDKVKEVEKICKERNVDLIRIGCTTEKESLIINHNDNDVVKLSIEEMKHAWTNGLKEALE
ncbi:AIR synthase-related protein, partial [Nanoarchaeota archaeon]